MIPYDRIMLEELTENLPERPVIDGWEEESAPSAAEDKFSFFSLFKPRKGFFITPVLIYINVLVFIIMAVSGMDVMQPNQASLIAAGANFRPLTLNGQAWRLLTNFFLHIGVIHLSMNMYALLFIGILLEPYLGGSRFSSAYILSGICASVASLWWHPYTISAGASGAIFGMYGVFLAMLTTRFIEKRARMALLLSIGIFVVYNLANGMTSGIDNAAHLGGLAGGVVIGWVFMPALRKPGNNVLKYATIAIAAVVTLTVCFVVYSHIPNDKGMYEYIKKLMETSTGK